MRGERLTDVIFCGVQNCWHIVVEDTAGLRPRYSISLHMFLDPRLMGGGNVH